MLIIVCKILNKFGIIPYIFEKIEVCLRVACVLAGLRTRTAISGCFYDHFLVKQNNFQKYLNEEKSKEITIDRNIFSFQLFVLARVVAIFLTPYHLLLQLLLQLQYWQAFHPSLPTPDGGGGFWVGGCSANGPNNPTHSQNLKNPLRTYLGRGYTKVALIYAGLRGCIHHHHPASPHVRPC